MTSKEKRVIEYCLWVERMFAPLIRVRDYDLGYDCGVISLSEELRQIVMGRAVDKIALVIDHCKSQSEDTDREDAFERGRMSGRYWFSRSMLTVVRE